MKKGKLILGGVAVLVTAASALAFKTAKKYIANPMYVSVNGVCLTCANLFTTAGHLTVATTKCKTTNLRVDHAGGGNNSTIFYTSKVSPESTICQHPAHGQNTD